ncbi:DUF6191 domain-containing protein [Amycolatopsis alkalitolerans]|uniref:Uncharacterized protein n=1 Tax=Amycolatopsis alkalitolerans TaxID=2547244 RepID=A0A5C4M855_9PSEU|nr:DUF6191 domain-containing protein [Amycolatopsis alkalitolerans]TNC29063.1 hypothetical protein FG385_02850 [Amycolatopsis alkalitolerans]
MATVFEWSLPGGVLLLVATAVYETLRHRHRRKRKTPLATTYVNEFTAMFYGTKRMELDHRESMSMMRDEDAQGAPPDHGVDLNRGVARLNRPDGP